MKIFHAIADAGLLEGHALCLGNFDGVHLGHRALVQEASRWGRPAALTFEPHPGKVLKPELAPKLIATLSRKLELLEEVGVELTLVQPFTPEYARSSPDAFESSLLDQLGIRHFVVGGDFTYGQARGGNADTLKKAAMKRGGALHVVPPVTVEGVVVSSSKIREYVLEGRVLAAKALLGRFFDIDGEVVRGAGRGRTIGFPTANVEIANELRPGSGVYAVSARLENEQLWRAGAANIGVKPTFGGTQITVEVHLLDFDGELYGKKLRLRFLDRIRGEQRFQSAVELAAQIRRDVEQARLVNTRAL